MDKFKVGDRVKYINNYFRSRTNQIATIIELLTEREYPCARCKFSDNMVYTLKYTSLEKIQKYKLIKIRTNKYGKEFK